MTFDDCKSSPTTLTYVLHCGDVGRFDFIPKSIARYNILYDLMASAWAEKLDHINTTGTNESRVESIEMVGRHEHNALFT